eukprot:CAMPEP_0175939082 /NCGR_PEP_ID=MMETSP0108-20121206/23059_1 /TAXON_ID=195067 ORGANISM="Goniomonas pacifica, Strain CCMP1869" /NCGR_SAMPLE_ID=MMETSP0108 /ASSEMBLY_ACC=CAM_ASM_000204 /LENGTH=271 /DNA_ID=CAMNT_0017263415 /DNA_START=19 /DNA_END=835 /DNA_ORIENTATION=-
MTESLNKDWKIIDTSHKEAVRHYASRGRSYSRAVFTVTIEREPQFWFAQYCLPVVVLEFITCLGLWLPVTAHVPRVMLCVISILTVLTLRGSAAAALPKVSYSTYFDISSSLPSYSPVSYSTYFDIYLLLAVLLSAISLMWNIAVCHISSHTEAAASKQTFILNGVGKLLLPVLSWIYFSLLLLVAWEPIAAPIVIMTLGLLAFGVLRRNEVRAIVKEWKELQEQKRGDRNREPEVLPPPPPKNRPLLPVNGVDTALDEPYEQQPDTWVLT